MTPTRVEQLEAALRGLMRTTDPFADLIRFGEHAPLDAYLMVSDTRLCARQIQDLKAARMTALAVLGVT